MVGCAGSTVCIVHADVILTQSKVEVKVTWRWLSAPFRGLYSLFFLLVVLCGRFSCLSVISAARAERCWSCCVVCACNWSGAWLTRVCRSTSERHSAASCYTCTSIATHKRRWRQSSTLGCGRKSRSSSPSMSEFSSASHRCSLLNIRRGSAITEGPYDAVLLHHVKILFHWFCAVWPKLSSLSLTRYSIWKALWHVKWLFESHSRSLEMALFNRPLCHFLLVGCRNHVSVLHHFWDIPYWPTGLLIFHTLLTSSFFKSHSLCYFLLIYNISTTISTGTVHTSVKARLPVSRDLDRHQYLIICSLAHCQPSLKISCKSVWKFFAQSC